MGCWNAELLVGLHGWARIGTLRVPPDIVDFKKAQINEAVDASQLLMGLNDYADRNASRSIGCRQVRRRSNEGKVK